MAQSRYVYTKNISEFVNNNFSKTLTRKATWTSINSKDIESNEDEFYTFTVTDRLDTLAAKYYGDGRYWWVICLANNLLSPFDKNLTPGKVLRIPNNINKILNKLKINANKV